jgi:hypothetical protein
VEQVEELQRQLAASQLEAERARAGEKARRDAEEKANKEREVGSSAPSPVSPCPLSLHHLQIREGPFATRACCPVQLGSARLSATGSRFRFDDFKCQYRAPRPHPPSHLSPLPVLRSLISESRVMDTVVYPYCRLVMLSTSGVWAEFSLSHP